MDLRTAQPEDFPSILALNEQSVRYLSPLSPKRLARLNQLADLHVVIEKLGEVVAFLLALREHANYDSVNYQWFEQRYPSFLYIDRVVVAHNVQANGAGSSLYRRAFSHAADSGIPMLACEFDVDPPNPVSERFHTKFGFREVGQHFVANRNKLVSLRIAMLDATHG